MIRNEFLRKIFLIQRNITTVRLCSSKLNIQTLEEEQVPEVTDEEQQRREEEIESKRNKSRLKVADYNMLHDKDPYPEPTSWHHGTLKYIRRTYGRYGEASGVDPAICWPVKQERDEVLEYENIKYSYTIPEIVQAAKVKREIRENKMMERQQDIIKKMEKLEQWKQELHDKISRRETEAQEARLRRERLIEEVKRHFGYQVDPREDRFKELLEKKEKEQKKLMKEARKKAREDKTVKRLKKNQGDGDEKDDKETSENAVKL